MFNNSLESASHIATSPPCEPDARYLPSGEKHAAEGTKGPAKPAEQLRGDIDPSASRSSNAMGSPASHMPLVKYPNDMAHLSPRGDRHKEAEKTESCFIIPAP